MVLIIPVTLVVTSGTTAVTWVNTLEPIQPSGNFIAPAGLPVALQASVLSPTGTPITGTVVQLAFRSGDAPVILTDSGGGTYTAFGRRFRPARCPLCFGSISSLFGENLSSQAMLATSLTLPLTLGGASVTLNGIAAPLFYTSSGQINFFVPYELTGQTAATVTVFDAGLAPGFAGLYQMNVVVPTGLRRRRYCCACAEGD